MEPEIIKAGDDAGNRMVVKYTSPEGVVIHGIGVPQAWDSPLGPTWCYVVEGDKLTLVDAGCNGTLTDLEEGLQYVGYPLSAVSRMVVTHGHLDHDGNCFDVIARSGAELWAHEVYGSLLGLDRWNLEADWRQRLMGDRRRDHSEFDERIQEHERLGKMMSLTNPVTDGMVSGGLTFYYTPGHAPDELCILYDRILFSGDHVLPQITPHPSVSMSYQRFRSLLPEDYQLENRYYGLKIFIQSLKRVSKLGADLTVMPAHRAYHGGKFHPIGVDRASAIADHHRTRCHDLIDLLRKEPLELSTLTRKHFSHLNLDNNTYYPAFSEVISHVELLEEMGDVSLAGTDGRTVQWKGTENFSSFFDQD
ncbi:MAG: MBL fold metallo-hydrolase [Chloroflexi bacterium]|nr:MBL fold metallo-hydrolase [Chloroflexota bacterium]